MEKDFYKNLDQKFNKGISNRNNHLASFIEKYLCYENLTEDVVKNEITNYNEKIIQSTISYKNFLLNLYNSIPSNNNEIAIFKESLLSHIIHINKSSLIRTCNKENFENFVASLNLTDREIDVIRSIYFLELNTTQIQNKLNLKRRTLNDYLNRITQKIYKSFKAEFSEYPHYKIPFKIKENEDGTLTFAQPYTTIKAILDFYF